MSSFQAKLNAERLQRLWEEEQKSAAAAGRKPSLVRSVLSFCRTRIFFAAIFLIISVVVQFLAPVTSLLLLYSFCHSPELDGFDQHFQAHVHFPLTSIVRLNFGNNGNQTRAAGWESSIVPCSPQLIAFFSIGNIIPGPILWKLNSSTLY